METLELYKTETHRCLKTQHISKFVGIRSYVTPVYSHYNPYNFTDILIKQKTDNLIVSLSDNGSVFELPYVFTELVNQINNSKYILDLKDNWDDEGSIGYQANTFIKAISLLIKYTLWVWCDFRKKIETPQIFPSHNGSIDLFWNKDKYDLLINIPADSNIVKFYGDDKKDTKIKGEFPIESYHQGILLCLLNQ